MSGAAIPSRALREQVGISRSTHTLAVRVSGADTFPLLERLCSSDLSMRDGRMLQTLILSPEGAPAADLFVCADDEDCLLLVEGLTFAELRAVADAPETRADDDPPGTDVQLTDLSLTHEVLGVDGPYAFELLADVIGTDVLGLPYASFFTVPGGHCFRAGKSGEYGYLLLLERSAAEATWQALRGHLPRFGGVELTLGDLDLAALENGFFSLRHAPGTTLVPAELQLSWRTSRRKVFRGSEAAFRPASQRLVHFVSPHPVERGSAVSLDGEPVGSVHACLFSHLLGAHVGLLHLQERVAHPGLFLHAQTVGSRATLATCSVPWLHNRSLYVNPRESRYVARDERVFPAIVPDALRELVRALASEGPS